MYKFLYGPVRAIKESGINDIPLDVEPIYAIIMTVKKDIYQHSEMAKDCALVPFNGGFIQRFEVPSKTKFFGESISCQVKTDESMNKVYSELLKDGEYWVTKIQRDRQEHTVGMICPKGYVLDHDIWNKTTREELTDKLESEESSNYW